MAGFAVKGDKYRLMQCLGVLNDLGQIESAEIGTIINHKAPENSPIKRIVFDVLGSSLSLREECGSVIVAIRTARSPKRSEHIFQAATLEDVYQELAGRGVKIHWFNHEKEATTT